MFTKAQFIASVLIVVVTSSLAGCVTIQDQGSPSPATGNLRLMGSAGERAWAVDVHERYGYMVDQTSGLHIVDLSDATQPRELGFLTVPGGAFGVSVVGSYAYVAAGHQGLVVIDVHDPSHPREVAHLTTAGHAYAVKVAGTIAYVAAGAAGLAIVNISEPAIPVLVTTVHAGFAQALALSGNRAYLAGGTRLLIVDVSDPAHAQLTATYDAVFPVHGLALDGEQVYLAADNGVHVVSVAAAEAKPRQIGLIAVAKRQTAQAVMVAGGRAYVTYLEDKAGGVLVADVSDPQQPRQLASYQVSHPVQGVQVVGDQLYVSVWPGGLYTFVTP
jgi:hypothetical protein